MIIELKWNQGAKSALEQIRQKRYPAVLKDFGGELLLVGITYDTKTKEHSCRIEKASGKE